MPGDALLFRGLSHSTIGAVWFHGRVREGIGWVTDAMVTKQWSWRFGVIDARAGSIPLEEWNIKQLIRYLAWFLTTCRWTVFKAVVDGGAHRFLQK